MPKGVYKHKTAEEEGIKSRSLGFRDGRLLDEIDQICKNPLVMNLAPENCRGRVYKTVWWGMKYLMKMIESRTIRREVPLFPDDDADAAELRRLHERITELEAIEAGNVQTIDDLTKQLNKKNTEIARLKQVNYTVNMDELSQDPEVTKIVNDHLSRQPSKKRMLDAKEQTKEVIEELWQYCNLFEAIYVKEYGMVPGLDNLVEHVDKIYGKDNNFTKKL
jgi:uncharacterized coiled-coil protein SlyX